MSHQEALALAETIRQAHPSFEVTGPHRKQVVGTVCYDLLVRDPATGKSEVVLDADSYRRGDWLFFLKD